MRGEHEVTFVVRISTVEEPDQTDIDRLAHFMAVQMHRGFGIDRVGIYQAGRKFVFDPQHDAEHFGANVAGKWTGPLESKKVRT